MSTTRWPEFLPRAAALAALLLLAACSGGGDRTPKEDARPVEGFESIELRGGARVDVQVGQPASLVVSGGADAVANLESRVTNGTLVLQSRRRGFRVWTGGEPVRLRVTLPTLRTLTINGATEAQLNGPSGGELDLVVNGAASFQASGSVDRLTARLNGAGNMDLSRLSAVNATVEANGAGNITVYVTGSLDARVNGVGSIRYRGAPAQVQTAINGVGSIAAD
jgi:hypothetical protein